MYATEYAESLRFFASHRYTYGYVLSPMTYGCGGPQNGVLASNWSHAPTSTLFNCNAGVTVQGLASPARGFLMMVVAMSAGCGACHRHATRRRALARAPRLNASLTASLTASRAWRASGVLG